MTEYVLDVSKWICGCPLVNGVKENTMGFGDTKMLNSDGFMCCLGQFAFQVGVPESTLLDQNNPANVASLSTILYDHSFVRDTGSLYPLTRYDITQLTHELMDINDSSDTTVHEKIYKLKERLEKDGHTLKVINGDQYL